MPNKHPAFISISAMTNLMKRKRYAPRASRSNGSRSMQLAKPIQQDGSARPGPVYRWNPAQNGWTLREG